MCICSGETVADRRDVRVDATNGFEIGRFLRGYRRAHHMHRGGGQQQKRASIFSALYDRDPAMLGHYHHFSGLEGPKDITAFDACKIILPLRQSPPRSEEHTSELQSLMRISYAVFCLKK